MTDDREKTLRALSRVLKETYISFIRSSSQSIQKYKDMGKFFKERKKIFRLMEDSYISSRYLSREFTKEEAEELLNAAEEVLKWRNT
ncbi:HEPN domain-containing protein [Candidatus Methanodesulfokora washburnensis]|uniref:HEPN domain-containing protein n=1 Tax=Candidatus Methanodesulfokora washburnensis TaxID=2478471 RepID=UPI0023514C6B|nr:HEPN domain-containing protein [Candidatus Methanodesulfokores washburnensis]